MSQRSTVVAKGRGGEEAVPSGAATRIIAETDAQGFAGQYPAYAAAIAGNTRKALDALRADPIHARRYAELFAAMVYGEQIVYDDAMSTVTALAARGLM